MPGGDRTGPLGQRPMTGRGLGLCSGYTVPGTYNPGFGYGRGMAFKRGMGSGGGFRRRYLWNVPYPVVNPYPVNLNPVENEKDILVNQMEILTQQLNAIKQRLENLEKEEEK